MKHRLTYDKNGTEPKIYDCDFLDNSKCIQKLGQLEDIEDKWGISIALVDRIFDYLDEVYLDNSDKPFYVKHLDGIDTVTPVYMQFDRRNKRLLETYSADGSGPTEYPFSEYGKTWALTREELK